MRRIVQVSMPVTSRLMRLSTDNNSTNFPEQTRLAVIRSVPLPHRAASTGWFAFFSQTDLECTLALTC